MLLLISHIHIGGVKQQSPTHYITRLRYIIIYVNRLIIVVIHTCIFRNYRGVLNTMLNDHLVTVWRLDQIQYRCASCSVLFNWIKIATRITLNITGTILLRQRIYQI